MHVSVEDVSRNVNVFFSEQFLLTWLPFSADSEVLKVPKTWQGTDVQGTVRGVFMGVVETFSVKRVHSCSS